MKEQGEQNRTALFEVGWWVALTLKPDVAPTRCCVGQIRALTDDGVRITLIDWISGMAAGYDVYVPHRNIESALVCTDEHDLEGFGERDGKWQMRMDGEGEEPQRARKVAELRRAALAADGEQAVAAAQALIQTRRSKSKTDTQRE